MTWSLAHAGSDDLFIGVRVHTPHSDAPAVEIGNVSGSE